MLQRISHRIAALIIIAMAGLLITGMNSLTQVTRLGADIKDLTTSVVPSIELLDDAEIAFYSVRTSLLLHVIEQDPDKKQLIEAQINEGIQRFNKALKDYEPFLMGEEDKKLLVADRAAFEEYLKVLDMTMGYSRSNDTTSSMAIASTKLRAAAVATLSALEAHSKFNHDDAQKTLAEAQATVSSARWLVVVVVVASLGLLLWFAYTTYQKVVGTALRARAEVIRVVEQLDFSKPLPAEGKDELSELLQALNRLIGRLREGLGSVRSNADHLNRSAEELALASRQVTSSSSAQSDAAATMAASVEQVTVSISHVSDRTGEASRITRQSGEQAEGGRDAVARTAQRIGAISSLVDEASEELARLEESGRQISAVVSVIKEVADQTNLLALNAAIEAARAGEQGRGFAVVADEVRKLAERTATSTVEITNMVATIQQRSGEVSRKMADAVASVREGVGEATSTREAMAQIAQGAIQSGDLVGEIATALREQSAASNQIAGQVERVAQMAEENSRAAERSAELAAVLQQLADAMNRDVAAYRLD